MRMGKVRCWTPRQLGQTFVPVLVLVLVLVFVLVPVLVFVFVARGPSQRELV